MSQLQQDVRPLPWDEVAAVLRGELGAPPEQVFADIDQVPLAAASIGQVHRTRLPGGAQVVVKVQRPGIGPVIERDLDIAFRFARILQSNADWGRSLGTVALADGFAAAIREELDYRIEARNATALAAVVAEHSTEPVVRIPIPYPDLCTERVLVLEYLSGTTLSSLGRGDAPQGSWPVEQRDRDAHALFTTLLHQVLLDGVFHADPHPGNIMRLDDGALALLDLGALGRIGPDLRAGLQGILLAVQNTDPLQLSDALVAALGRPDQLNEPQLVRDLGRFISVHLGPGTVPDMAMFTELLRILTGHRLSVPAEVAAAFRAFATMDGTLRALAPSFDMVAQARQFAAAQVRAKLEPAALTDAVTDELLSALPHLRRLPRQLDQFADAMTEGRLSIRTRMLADPDDRHQIAAIVHLLVLAFLGGSTGLMATLLLISSTGPPINNTLSLYQLFGYLLVIVSALFVLRVAFDVFRPRR